MRYRELRNIRREFPGRDIQIKNADANNFLQTFEQDWRQWRGILFLDPFATQVSWATIETIAGFNALDMWILFPTHAISRLLPAEQTPEEIHPRWADRLDRIYGDDSWRTLYRTNPQGDLFEPGGQQRERGVQRLIGVYKDKLQSLFGNRFLRKSGRLANSRNSPFVRVSFLCRERKRHKPCLPGSEPHSGPLAMKDYAAGRCKAG